MNVYESEFLRLDFFEDEKLLEMTWLPATEMMFEKNYKEEFTNSLDIVLNYKPKKIIANNQALFFTISIELQEWTNQAILAPSLEVGLNKSAFVISTEFMSQLSIEQTMEEGEGKKFMTKFFNNKEDAKEWILSLPLD